jgi:hypothetical protein
MPELEKIIKGYCNASKDSSLNDIAKLVGMHKTVVSKNNPFLAELGVVKGGKKKVITDIGSKFGRAIEHNHISDIQKYLSDLVGSSEFFSDLITTVRIKNGMSFEELSKHILYVSGQKTNAQNKTGAKAVIDLFKKGDLLAEKDGKLFVSKTPTLLNESGEALVTPTSKQVTEGSNKQYSKQLTASGTLTKSITPTVNINIQLQIPESDNPEVYENLFKSLRKHLLDHDE